RLALAGARRRLDPALDARPRLHDDTEWRRRPTRGRRRPERGQTGVCPPGTGLVGSEREVTNGDRDRYPSRYSSRGLLDLLWRIVYREGAPLKIARVSRAPALRGDVALERACLCARVAAENKARDVVVLDMRGITPLYDYFVLVTGTSRRQIHTIAEEVDAAL